MLFVLVLPQKRKLGPGSYEIKDFVQTADLKPRSERGICQNLAPRFSLGSQVHNSTANKCGLQFY